MGEAEEEEEEAEGEAEEEEEEEGEEEERKKEINKQPSPRSGRAPAQPPQPRSMETPTCRTSESAPPLLPHEHLHEVLEGRPSGIHYS